NNSFLGEYECSFLALDREERRDKKKRLDHLKQDQTMLVIKRFSERKKAFRERKKTGKIRAKRRKVQYVSAKGSNYEEKLVHVKMVLSRRDYGKFGFLEGLDEEALVEFMVECCEDDDRSGEDDLFN
ncbi:hypothetical protein Tco_1532611, partial [Tanacetum coccineum]